MKKLFYLPLFYTIVFYTSCKKEDINNEMLNNEKELIVSKAPDKHTINLDEAEIFAINYFNEIDKKVTRTKKKSFILSVEKIDKKIYVVNMSPSGWILLSDNKMDNPILAFSLKNSFDMSNFIDIPENVKIWLLNTITANINIEKSKNDEPIKKNIAEWNIFINNGNQKFVDPDSCREYLKGYVTNTYGNYLSSTWGQDKPYNLLTTHTLFYGGHCDDNTPTGCVATALAQVLNYWQYPPQDNNGVNYNWNIMQNSYFLSDTSASAYEVAKLMVNCSDYLDSWHWSCDATGASFSNCKPVLNFIFHYSTSDVVDYADNSNALRQSLENGKSVLMAGSSNQLGTNGHAWVADGYKETYDEYFVVCDGAPYYGDLVGLFQKIIIASCI